MFQETDDLLAATKRRRIVEKQDEYHKRMYNNMTISPRRTDPFADGKYVTSRVVIYILLLHLKSKLGIR